VSVVVLHVIGNGCVPFGLD